jgi:transformation/transcription domain-associated protein
MTLSWACCSITLTSIWLQEALGAIRNLSITDLKSTYPDSVQYLLDERLVFGNLRSEPGLCGYTYSTIGETYQQVRPHMSIQQILPFFRRFAELISDSSLPHGMLTLISKLLVGSFDYLNTRLRNSEAPTAAVTRQVNTVMHALIETLCTRVQSAVTNGQRLMALRDGSVSEEIKQLAALEQSRTVPVIHYLANDNYEASLMGKFRLGGLNNQTDPLLDERFLVRASAMCFKTVMQIIRTLDGRVPDADVMGRAFRNLCLAVPLMRGDSAETSYYKVVAETFSEMEPHVFQMVWTTNMDMFFTQVLTQPNLTTILTFLFQQPSTTYSLTALVLRYLTDNLETLLENSSPGVAIIIRTVRLTFQSVALLANGLEKVVFPHLPRLLVDVFAMAARSQDPRNFLSVPYYLFRAFGNKNNTARNELFHKEIFPLLPEVLDGVNRALEMTEDAVQREQLVEISLTTPARLQHLAPYMAQLWRPLVLALGSRSPELLRQGLRTLELATDNVSNIDLLDPEAEPVARDLVVALHKVLKPGAAVADLSQAASRILGKIGGRNRRILSMPPSLAYETFTIPATIPVEFTSHVAPLQVLPACEIAVKVLGDGKAGIYHDSAFSVLRNQILYLLQTVRVSFYHYFLKFILLI